LPASTFVETPHAFTCGQGVLSFRRSDGCVAGMGFRTTFDGKPVLGTAGHVWKEFTRQGDNFSIEANGVTLPLVIADFKLAFYSKEADVILFYPPQTLFSVLRVKSIPSASYVKGKQIMVVGYRNGKLTITYGSVFGERDGGFGLTHYASTLPGYSGTPIIYQGKMVGVHLASNGVDANLGVSCVWLHFKENGIASNEYYEGFDARSYEIVSELPRGKSKKMRFRTYDYEYEAEQVGRFIKIGSAVNVSGNSHWTVEDDLNDLYDEEDSHRHWEFRRSPSPSSVTSSAGSKKRVRRKSKRSSEKTLLEAGFPKGEESPQSTPTNLVKERQKPSPLRKEIVHEPSGTSVTQAVDQSTLSRKKKVPVLRKSIPGETISGALAPSQQKDSDFMKLVDARLRLMEEKQQFALTLLNEQLNLKPVLQSGIIRHDTPALSVSPCLSRQPVTEVSIVLMSRKQEKLYNRICHTRKFQQALRDRTPDQIRDLRLKLLDYVMSLTTRLRGNPHQDFLSML